MLGFLILALFALMFVSKIATEIRDIYAYHRAAAVAREVAIRRWERSTGFSGAGGCDITSSALLVESTVLAVKQVVSRLRKWWRHTLCVLIHGHHELYRARSATKLFQQCLLCGYETPGWTIDRRDRRLHLVTNDPRIRKAS